MHLTSRSILNLLLPYSETDYITVAMSGQIAPCLLEPPSPTPCQGHTPASARYAAQLRIVTFPMAR
jgi:hypothetical protein